jgi:hypothetical protein
VGQGGVEPPTLGFSERKGEKSVISKPLIFGLISRQEVKRLGNLISICSAQIFLFYTFLLSLITNLSQMSDSIILESLLYFYGTHADASRHIYCGLARQILSCIELDHVIVSPLGEDFLGDDLLT